MMSCDEEMAERTGLEPPTPGVTGRYSNQLNYLVFSQTLKSAPAQRVPDLPKLHRLVTQTFVAATLLNLRTTPPRGRQNRCHCRSSYPPDTLEANLKK